MPEKTEIDPVEYVEQRLGVKLFNYQKELIRQASILNTDRLYIVMPPQVGRFEAEFLMSIFRALCEKEK